MSAAPSAVRGPAGHSESHAFSALNVNFGSFDSQLTILNGRLTHARCLSRFEEEKKHVSLTLLSFLQRRHGKSTVLAAGLEKTTPNMNDDAVSRESVSLETT